MVVAQFWGGLHEDIRAKVFGIPNPPATIEAALTAASAAKAEKTNQKLVFSLVDETQKDKEGQAEMTELEKNSKGSTRRSGHLQTRSTGKICHPPDIDRRLGPTLPTISATIVVKWGTYVGSVPNARPPSKAFGEPGVDLLVEGLLPAQVGSAKTYGQSGPGHSLEGHPAGA